MQANAEDTASINCVECSIELPIRISSEADSSRIRCRFCGAVYRGTPVRDADQELLANIEVLEEPAD